ncbi:hypothetical protein [Flammeovirga agarivorans]|uniref:Uncharacterized protein n=1 Tax=Flammeovirga agarivorans TaxID=2726742 RepID=A0A7X8SK84_9BACT|nr:hypothetical protein [Flammeovirga agarivorans]NLR91746.1 hypothetical protein [Flammeovirga agarivorans]
MKRSFIVLVLILIFAGPDFAQNSKILDKKIKEIHQRIDDYQGFLTLSNEEVDTIYDLYLNRYLKKDSIHRAVLNDESLSKYEKIKMKKRVDKETDLKLMNLLSFEEYIQIKCHHQTIIRLGQIQFINPLNENDYQRILVAMREMRYHNILVAKEFGKSSPIAKEKMMENRSKCAAIEKEIFTEDMYTHLKKLNLLTIVDWGKDTHLSDADEMSSILDGYNILEPVGTYR